MLTKCVSIPLTLQEKYLFNIMDVNPEGRYLIEGSWTIHVPINLKKLHNAFQRVVDNNPALRTIYSSINNNYVKFVRKQVPVQIESIVPETILIDPFKDPMIRCFFTKDKRLILSVHHLVADGASASRLVLDLLREYSFNSVQFLINRCSSLSLLHAHTFNINDLTILPKQQLELLKNKDLVSNIGSFIRDLKFDTLDQHQISSDLTSYQLTIDRERLLPLLQSLPKLSISQLILYLLGISSLELLEKKLMVRVLLAGKSPITLYSATAFPAVISSSTIKDVHSELANIRSNLINLGVWKVLTLESLLNVFSQSNKLSSNKSFVSIEYNYLPHLMSSPPPPVFSQLLLDIVSNSYFSSNGRVDLGDWDVKGDLESEPVYCPPIRCTVHENLNDIQVDLSSRVASVSAKDLGDKIERLLTNELDNVVVSKSQSSHKYLIYSTLIAAVLLMFVPRRT